MTEKHFKIDDDLYSSDLSLPDKAITFIEMPLFVILAALPPVIFHFEYGLDWLFTENSLTYWLIMIPIFLAGFVLHEALHALAWKITSKAGKSEISFGLSKSFVPFSHIRKELSKGKYSLGVLAPVTIMGTIPVILAFVLQLENLVIPASFFLGMGVSDLILMLMIIPLPPGAKILDHSDRYGFYALHAEKLEKPGFFKLLTKTAGSKVPDFFQISFIILIMILIYIFFA